jgi:prepilin-type processing-associated H-X9-DG protein
VAILPYIEQASLFKMFNPSRWIWGPSTAHDLPAPPTNQNGVVTGTKVDTFICPTAPPYSTSSFAGNNYAWNVGSTLYWDNAAMNGPIQRTRDTLMAGITDGLSNTILLSEIVSGDADGTKFTFPRDVLAGVPLSSIPTYVMPPPSQVDALGAANTAAMNGGAASGHQSNLGDNWACNGVLWSTYNTVAPPNWSAPTSHYGGSGAWLLGVDGVFPARSYHPGGVNAALCDASVRFIAQTIDLVTYQCLGARNDGSAVTVP